MESHIKLGRIFGVQIGLHLSWLLIALLVTLSLAAHFSEVNPGWARSVIWSTAVVTGLLFFVAIILHELAHAVVAKMRGVPVRSITLFALGGVAQIEKDSSDATTEFWIGIAGPVASVAIGILCLIAAAVLGEPPSAEAMTPPTPVLAALVWLGYINIMLAVFNMIPGFPLDGGRILRAIIWWITNDADRSTKIAARVGQFIAVLFIVWGLLQFFTGAGFSGLWIAFIGWFLLTAAGATYAQVEVMGALRGLHARDVMRRDCQTVDANLDVEQFVNENVLRTGNRCYLVADDEHLTGIITPHEIKGVAREKWETTLVRDVMRPLDSLHTVAPETSLSEALERMGRDDVNQLPVVKHGRIVGILTRGSILQVFQTRAELQV